MSRGYSAAQVDINLRHLQVYIPLGLAADGGDWINYFVRLWITSYLVMMW